MISKQAAARAAQYLTEAQAAVDAELGAAWWRLVDRSPPGAIGGYRFVAEQQLTMPADDGRIVTFSVEFARHRVASRWGCEVSIATIGDWTHDPGSFPLGRTTGHASAGAAVEEAVCRWRAEVSIIANLIPARTPA